MENSEKIYSVTQLTGSIRRNLLANNEKLVGVWIEGEISGCRLYSSGARYFDLKDNGAQISCVLFAFALGGCSREFTDLIAGGGDECVNGLKVQVEGELDLSMKRGRYSFKIRRLRIAGQGDRMAEFNALKARLEREGLNKLDHPELRRPLPFLPRRIGIVTSSAGAVIHDMCDVLFRRFPNLEVRLYPAKVQGVGAAAEIAAGIAYFNSLVAAPEASWRPEVVIVGRGGGSVEDLWCFNEEPVVFAVAGALMPIISAVGHESDTTLCDYAADFRAGTPSIAAERAVPVRDELLARIRRLQERLARLPRQAFETQVQQLDYLVHRLASAPLASLAEAGRRLDGARMRLAPAIRARCQELAARLDRAALPLEARLEQACERAAARVKELDSRLRLLNPYAVLGRGYSLTLDESGRVLRAVADAAPGMRLVTRLADGEVRSVVTTEEVRR